MQNPGHTHKKAMKWIMKYFQGTCDYWLQFTRTREDETTLTSYCDLN
jgi:hypothetical protein